MAYVGASPANRALTSADIAPGSVTLNDINFTDTPTNMNITGVINKHTMRLAEGVTVTGDITISDNLILSKISDDGVGITLTNDSSTRTITGSGSIEASTLAQTPNASLTGMTGTVGSGVTFPAGHIVRVLSVQKTNISSTATVVTGTRQDIADLTLTMPTPKSSSSKYLCTANLAYGMNGDVTHIYTFLHRAIAGGASAEVGNSDARGSRTRSWGVANAMITGQMQNNTLQFLDSPGTAAAVTYKLQWNSGNTQTIYINRSNRDQDAASSDGTGTSTFTVMEIA